MVLIFAAFLAANRVALRKCVLVKATCFWRSALLVVAEQCRSSVPFTISGIRFDEVTATYSTAISGVASCLLHGVDDLEADIHGEADRLLVAVEIAEGHGGFPGSRA